MSVIVPRWEWRTFGASFGAADAMLAGLTPTGVEESDELYLLSEDGDNVKVRAELMDIKVLRDVDRHGLERWEPALKAGFPLAAADVAAAFEALRQPLPMLARDAYSLAEFLDELVEPGEAIRLVSVHKRRVRYTFDECMGELTDIDVGGRHTRTLAIEAEDPAAVWASVIALGLGDRVNTSVPQRFARPHPRRAPSIRGDRCGHELGEVPRRRADQRRGVAERSSIGPRSPGSATGWPSRGRSRLPPWSERRRRSLAWSRRRWKHHAQAIVAVGTAGLRTASNRDEVVAAIEAATGVTVDTISGEEESRLAYLAVRADLRSGDGALVVFDTGGGSTQFTFGHGAEVDERFSVDVGAVRYTERFGLDAAVSTEALQAALDAIASDLRSPGRQTGARRPGGHGWCDHEHHRREARPRPVRPRRRPGGDPRACRHRPSDRAVSVARRSTPVARSSDSSPSGPT